MVITIKTIIGILKRLIYVFFLLFGINMTLQYLGIIIPINCFSLIVTYILGVFGAFALIIIKMFII